MNPWTIAAVQMDCQFADIEANLQTVRMYLGEAASRGARLVVFPECALTGYGYRSREEAVLQAQSLPGPASSALAEDCRLRKVYAIVGMIERSSQGQLFNSCMIVGPEGYLGSYRKIHLPFMGVDRFVDRGDRPFAVQQLEDLRVGVNICYDGTFPESARVLTVLGADLVVLPTNWPTGARVTVPLAHARALENHIYYAAVNRVGEERGFRYIGASRILDPDGAVLAEAKTEGPEILVATIDPAVARAKRVIKIPGEHEVDRVGDRRPDMYGPLTAGQGR